MCLEDAYCGKESCDSCWYSESSSFLHNRACRDDESSHLSLGITIWSFLCGFLYANRAGVSNTLTCIVYNKGFCILKLPFSLPPSVSLNLIARSWSYLVCSKQYFNTKLEYEIKTVGLVINFLVYLNTFLVQLGWIHNLKDYSQPYIKVLHDILHRKY